jgi:hypothetical protein
MGATIAPLTLAVEPRYRAAILSGAGGSWIENVIHKLSPLPVKPLAEILIGYPPRGLELTEHDPFLNLLQWAGEAADPPAYAWNLVHDAPNDPIHVLMLQGIVDTYILPPIANTTSLSLGLDLAGGSLDVDEPRLSEFLPLEELLPYREREQLTLPASGTAGATAVVVQHLEDGIEDGHEVMFQTEGARHQVRCFLESYLTGMPVVVAAGSVLDPCP